MKSLAREASMAVDLILGFLIIFFYRLISDNKT